MAALGFYDVILKPVVSETSLNGMGDNKYTFLVAKDATKTQIKEAVEKLFPGTKVESVNTMNKPGKERRRGLIVGRRAAEKKAVVTLKKDSKSIELFQGL